MLSCAPRSGNNNKRYLWVLRRSEEEISETTCKRSRYNYIQYVEFIQLSVRALLGGMKIIVRYVEMGDMNWSGSETVEVRRGGQAIMAITSFHKEDRCDQKNDNEDEGIFERPPIERSAVNSEWDSEGRSLDGDPSS